MKILFFAPYAAVWVHAFPESLVAESLAQHGHDIIYISCGRLFQRHCVAMSAFGEDFYSSSKSRLKICKICQKNANFIRNQYNFYGYDLDSVLDNQDISDVVSIIDSVNPSNFLEIVIDRIEIGRTALTTFLLTQKLQNFGSIKPEKWSILRNELYNTLLSFFAARKILNKESPSRLIMYSSTYSVNLIWCQLAELKNIPFYSMNAAGNLSNRLQRLLFSRFHLFNQQLPLYWERFRSIPCSSDIICYNFDHIIHLFEARSPFVYSSPKSSNKVNIREFFGISPAQKILLCTMSSPDEIVAAQASKLLPENPTLLFSTQISWLDALFEFIADHSELYLIVRPHPRNFPNKRDSVKSEHAEQLEMTFKELPPNVSVNWPSDNLSLYDIVEEVDVCLNAWSSVGEELGLLGIPVITYGYELAFIPSELACCGHVKDEYFQNIEIALNKGWNIEYSRLANRWAALKYSYSRLDISDSFQFSENNPIPDSIFTRVKTRIHQLIDPLHKQKYHYNVRARKLAVSSLINYIVTHGYNSVLDVLNIFPQSSIDQETLAIRNNFKRIINYLTFGSQLFRRLYQESNLST